MKVESIIFTIYVKKNYLKLLSFASTLVGYTNAQDLVQESLGKVYENLPNIKDVEHLERYTIKVIRNIAINQIQRNKVDLDLPIIEEGYLECELEFYDNDTARLVKKMILDLKLTLEEIKLFQLMLDGVPPREILKEFGLDNKSLESVKGKKKRLRKKLQRYFNNLPTNVIRRYDKRRYKSKQEPSG